MNEQMDDYHFIVHFFLEFLQKVSEARRNIGISTLFMENDLEFIEYMSQPEKYDKFMDITNSFIKNDVVSINDNVEYTIYLKMKKFGKSKEVLKFTSISMDMRDHIVQEMRNKEILDEIRTDILDYAYAAPLTAKLLKQNVFKGELKKVPTSVVNNYLDLLCVLGFMRRKGQGLYILRD